MIKTCMFMSGLLCRLGLLKNIVTADAKGLFTFDRASFMMQGNNYAAFEAVWGRSMGNVDTFMALLEPKPTSVVTAVVLVKEERKAGSCSRVSLSELML